MEKHLVNKDYQLEKFQGKGGWTYVRIPEIEPNKHAHFGWVKVRGSIDSYNLKNFRLMPMGNGTLFLPVNATIRKHIGKSEGDFVRIILYKDDAPLELTKELIDCFSQEEGIYEQFLRLSANEQKRYLEWIYNAKNDSIKVERIVRVIEELKQGSA